MSEPTQAKSISSRWWDYYKVIVGVIALLGTVAGIVYHFVDFGRTREEVSTIYPRLEQLVAIYSLLNWRSPRQEAPIVTETVDTSSEANTGPLECGNIKWGVGGPVKNGELFSCFVEQIRRYIPVDGREWTVPRVSSNEDVHHDFKWESVLGYELSVMVSPSFSDNRELYELRDKVQAEGKRCREEGGGADMQSLCAIEIYAMRVEGLSVAKTVTFLVADGHIVWTPAGDPDRAAEWVVYLDDETPITAGQLNKLIQLAMRQLGMSETDLTKAMPQLEVKWQGKDKAYYDALFKEVDRSQDLMKIGNFLRGK